MSGHTPGPWRVSLPDETLILGPDRQIVATTLQDEEDYAANYDRRAADAVLIAAPNHIHAVAARAAMRATEAVITLFAPGKYRQSTKVHLPNQNGQNCR